MSPQPESIQLQATARGGLWPVFGYGSNNVDQVGQRVEATDLHSRAAKAVLRNYERKFVCFSKRWNGSIATVAPLAGAVCRGTLIWLSDEELRKLDKWEDVNSDDPQNRSGVYRREVRDISVLSEKTYAEEETESVRGFVYVKNISEPEGKPSVAYITAIVRNLEKFWSTELIAEELKGLEKEATKFDQSCIRA